MARPAAAAEPRLSVVFCPFTTGRPVCSSSLGTDRIRLIKEGVARVLRGIVQGFFSGSGTFRLTCIEAHRHLPASFT